MRKMRDKGYAGVSIDSTKTDSSVMQVYIYIGEPIATLYIMNGNVSEGVLADARMRSLQQPQEISMAEVATIEKKLLRSAENNGYPFAEVYLDSIVPVGKSYEASMMMDKHELFLFDTISNDRKYRLKRRFIAAYLGIKKGKPYDESKVKAAERRLNELPFVEQLQPPSVSFDKEVTRLNVSLKDKKASSFNFFLGILPGGAGQKVLVTGEAKFNLYGLLGFGEQIYLEWNKTLPKTQTLKVRLAWPYLFGLPLGVDGRFELYKRDTTWLDLDRELGLRYQFAGMDYLKASLLQRNTIVLKADTAYVRQYKTFPKVIDVFTNEFALEYFHQQLDYRFNPTKGWVLQIGGSAGVRKINKRSAIANLYDPETNRTFSYLYDSIKARAFRMQWSLSVEKYTRVTRRMTVLTSLKGRYIYSKQLFENEKYRIGGLGLLRGFDEEFFVTPFYLVGNVEYRFLLSKNSYAFAFFNAGMVEDMRNIAHINLPFGFGAGVSLETKAGIFGVAYAVGKQSEEKLSFRNSKIHFGYVNYF